MPCSPFVPTVAITTCVLEMYRVAHLRTPTLGIQGWPYLAQQFGVCYDLYLAILKKVEERVEEKLGRNTQEWHLKNRCPSCTYKLEGEAKMIFSMLTTCDGGNSLKRVLRKDRDSYDVDGNQTRGGSERPDPRTEGAGGHYYLSREKVDMWAKDRLAEMVNVPTGKTTEEKSNCEEKWKNLSTALTSKMWGIFDETGVFVCLCRHGFVMLIVDMIRSGELAKYPLAISNALMDAFGEDVAQGYDVGCGFVATLRNSPLGSKVARLKFRSLVGAFHGHAHHRECQLKFLATYVEGLGLEDMEGSERFFSVSNSLARSVRYASVFHRLQTITTYLAHRDSFDVYPNLSTFLINNYKEALKILEGEEALHFTMDQAGISGVHEFQERLDAELEYLKGLRREPEEINDKMEYYERLVMLQARTMRFDEVHGEGSRASGVVKRHARENHQKALSAVQESEQKLDILVWWTEESYEWEETATLVAQRRYRACINKLEELVLKRMFELTQMNRSHTGMYICGHWELLTKTSGYKLRTHIAKALQVRSTTIRAALVRYNSAAAALSPPGRALTWLEVVNYTFLSDFDLLRDPEMNRTIRSWATPAARHLLDTHFKIERAKEEIIRLDIEIRRLVTHIRDEKEFLVAKEAKVRLTDPGLAYFVRKYRFKRGRFDEQHLTRFTRFVAREDRFTGTLEPGTCLRQAVQEPSQPMEDVQDTVHEARDAEAAAAGKAEEDFIAEQMAQLEIEEDDGDSDYSDDEGEDVEAEEAAEDTEVMLTISGDREDEGDEGAED
ncbi:hypothetical protein C8J57DRAFT_1433838 [Mycena rebaudengoi]|nr:hypothetical protein C8J57DRAFT_1433838 [Mycena rebaudengoi]